MPVLSFHHPMTTQHLRTMHQHLHSTALEMEHHFCGQWMDSQLAHHMYSIKEYNTHPSSYHQMDFFCVLQLIVPTTKAKNNITVICTVQDSLFNHQSSSPVKLYYQGTVNICMYSLILIDELHVQSFIMAYAWHTL